MFLTLGQRIRARRVATGKTQEEAARLAQLSPSHLCDIERDRHEPPLSTLRRIATALGTDLVGLIQEGESVPPCPTP